MGGVSNGRYTILVVEDEPWIRLALVHHLEECNFHVLEAASVRDAIAALEHPGVDLVFTDLRLLGERDGIELARWVARNRPGIPVMLASGEIAQVKALQELCKNEGFIPFGKPYAHAEVSAQILELIEKRKSGRAEIPL
ncbi:MAG TPA: response regulator [Rhizomicrobium sp.]|nr:response regulator [Rhizomicrobium sp.]